jgi:hypothetical protein
MQRKNDALWKGILEEVFDDMLRFIFPDIDKVIDLKRGFVFLDKELEQMYPDPEESSRPCSTYRKKGLIERRRFG